MSSLRVQRIEIIGPDRNARKLVFGEAAEPRVTSTAVVKRLSLMDGSMLDFDELLAAERELARDRALRLLGYRDRSTHELCERLVRDGYSQNLAARTVQKLVGCGLVDDARFAATWARSRTDAGYGPHRIRQELARRGLDPDLIEATVERCSADDPEHVRSAIRGVAARTERERRRLVNRLVRRGFDLSAAVAAADALDDATDGPCIAE